MNQFIISLSLLSASFLVSTQNIWAVGSQFFCVADFNMGANVSYTVFTSQCLKEVKEANNWKQNAYKIIAANQGELLSVKCTEATICEKNIGEQFVRMNNLIESYTEYDLPAPKVDVQTFVSQKKVNTVIKYIYE